MASNSLERGSGMVSLVVPVYNEEEVIGAFYERATKALRAIDGMSYELIFVDDGSRDTSLAQLAAFAAKDPCVRVIKFSRNFGHQIAISAGIDHARGDCVAIIDADLQDPPEVIASMVKQWQQGFDVVYGVRSDRAGETRIKLWTASMFYRLMGRLTQIHIPANVGDFRLMSRRVVDQVKNLREKDRFVRGLVSWVGFRQTGVVYSRDARFAGRDEVSVPQDAEVLVRRHHVLFDRAAQTRDVDGFCHGRPRRHLSDERLRPVDARVHRRRLGNYHGRDAVHGQRSADLPRHSWRVSRQGLQRSQTAPDVRRRRGALILSGAAGLVRVFFLPGDFVPRPLTRSLAGARRPRSVRVARSHGSLATAGLRCNEADGTATRLGDPAVSAVIGKSNPFVQGIAAESESCQAGQPGANAGGGWLVVHRRADHDNVQVVAPREGGNARHLQARHDDGRSPALGLPHRLVNPRDLIVVVRPEPVPFATGFAGRHWLPEASLISFPPITHSVLGLASAASRAATAARAL